MIHDDDEIYIYPMKRHTNCLPYLPSLIYVQPPEVLLYSIMPSNIDNLYIQVPQVVTITKYINEVSSPRKSSASNSGHLGPFGNPAGHDDTSGKFIGPSGPFFTGAPNMPAGRTKRFKIEMNALLCRMDHNDERFNVS